MEANVENFKQRDVLNFNLKILRILGYWIPENCSKWGNTFYRMYTFTLTGLFIVHLIAEITVILVEIEEGNVGEVTNGSFLFFLNFTFVIKGWYLVRNKDRILSSIQAMDKDIFKPRNRKQFLLLEKRLKKIVTFCYLFIAMGVVTVILFGVFPFTDIEELQLPLSGFYPFQEQLFAVLFIYQVIEQTTLAMCNISIDCISACFLDHMCNQMDMLNNNLKSMKEVCKEKLKLGKQSLDEKINFDDELQKLIDDMLTECIIHYTEILSMKRDFEQNFGPGLFMMFLCDCIALCMTMFQLLLISIKSIHFLSMMIYMSCITTELMMYCWFGNELMVKGFAVTIAAYECDWIGTSVYFQKKLLLFITITMVPVKVIVVYLTLSVETFTSIMRTAWSYFAVLRQKYSEEK